MNKEGRGGGAREPGLDFQPTLALPSLGSPSFRYSLPDGSTWEKLALCQTSGWGWCKRLPAGGGGKAAVPGVQTLTAGEEKGVGSPKQA